ncbi:hypothetical protein [Clostridium sp. Cult2]|uniref:hypothetical protein n=1 Tax=Clostridium sp. Cult2 TaxID=2079003 RepID=UPI001F3D0704|nr:hypothetical protein [Clostridium sp. Cult2]MCF6466373.1 hypothetical protein [Clostridium sp. Cult2]
MSNKEALEYLVGLGYEKDILVETDKGLFSKVPLTRVNFPRVETLEVSNLTSITDYMKSNIDGYKEKLLIQVVSPREVRLLTPLNDDDVRDEILRAVAILPNNVFYDRFIDTERFNIMLQSGFTDNEDKELLLKFTGLIRDEAVKDTGDDGISQAVTIKTGVASVGDAQVPNPVTLAPFRTFPEVIQPESKFIFRMRSGPEAALYEADGGAWKNQAMKRIKEYLVENLNELEDEYEIIS